MAHMTGEELADFLLGYTAGGVPESALQDALDETFRAQGFNFIREHRLTKADRIDFFFPDSCLGLEIKRLGSLSAVTRQLFRYLQSPQLDELVLCTTLVKHTRVPHQLAGKPLYVACLASL